MPSVAQREPADMATSSSISKNIFLAASENDLETVKAHIAAGADINALDQHGYSCMHAAASYAHLTLLDLLVSHGGNLNLEDHDGDTPLFVVETAPMAALLIQCGADPEHRNKEGKRALQHHEEEDEFPEVIAYLRTVTKGNDTDTVQLPDGSTVQYEAGNDTRTQSDDGEQAALHALSQEQRDRIDALMKQSQEDGVNRDEELSKIIESALLDSGIWQDDAAPASTKARIE
jgi:ankyrin repeat protein